MHAFWAENIGEAGTEVLLEKAEREHLFKTLRAVPGERVRLLDGRGVTAVAMVEDGRILRVLSHHEAPVPDLRLFLGCAAPRKQKLDVLLKQLSEVGAWSVELMHCARSVAKPEGSDRWQILLREGCKQSGNPFLPSISVAGSLEKLLRSWRERNISAYYGTVVPGGVNPEVPAAGDVGFLVGPEGGFTPEEHEMLEEYGAAGISLGPWILRLETAAVCGLAALRAMGK